MNTKIKRTFSITITKDYKLICTIINIENQESSVYLDENNQTEEYIPCISFHNDRIMICQENEQNSINFLEEFIENPEQFELYSFEFQGKEYKIIAEVLFALIINEFKQKIEREYIIDQTIVQFPSQHCQISERIRNSLESIGLKNIFVDSLSFDYSEQSEVLQELLEKKDQIDTYQRMLKRARNYCETNKQIQQINYCQQSVVSEETFVNIKGCRRNPSFRRNERFRRKFFISHGYAKSETNSEIGKKAEIGLNLRNRRKPRNRG